MAGEITIIFAAREVAQIELFSEEREGGRGRGRSPDRQRESKQREAIALELQAKSNISAACFLI
jgi:hypothetical protein